MRTSTISCIIERGNALCFHGLSCLGEMHNIRVMMLDFCWHQGTFTAAKPQLIVYRYTLCTKFTTKMYFYGMGPHLVSVHLLSSKSAAAGEKVE